MKSTARATVLVWAMPALVLAIILAQQLAWLNLHTAVDTWDDDAGLFKLALCFAGMDASGNVGCAALADAMTRGGLPKVEKLFLSLDAFDKEHKTRLTDACRVRGIEIR